MSNWCALHVDATYLVNEHTSWVVAPIYLHSMPYTTALMTTTPLAKSWISACLITTSTLLGVINTVNDCGCGHDTVPTVTPVSSSLQDVLDDDESQPPRGWSIR